MNEENSYSLWLKPSGKVANQLQNKIEKLSQKFKTPLFPTHVSLIGGMRNSKTELISLTDTFAATLHPFNLTLTTVDCRDNFYQSLFVHIKKSNQLMELRKIAEQFFDTDRDEAFMPHASLLYSEFSRKEKELILNDIGREFYQDFPVKSLVLMQTDGAPEQWIKIHTSVFKDS